MIAAAVAVAATLVSGAFSVDLGRSFLRRRRPHAGVWAASLSLFAVACGMVAVGVVAGWHPAVYGIFWFAGALVTVPLLAVGQLLLLDPARSRVWLSAAAAVVMASALAVTVSPMEPAALADATARDGVPVGREVWGPSPATALLAPFNWSGLIVVIGCIWSAWRSRRPQVSLIGLGVVVAGASFGFVRAGDATLFTLMLALGVAIMYGGFRATAPRGRRGTDARTSEAESSGVGSSGGGSSGGGPSGAEARSVTRDA